MNTTRVLLAAPLLILAFNPAVATTLVLPNTAVIQNFDTLASSGTTNTAVPTGWSFAESGTGANTTYAAGTGSSTTGNTYSFGATSAVDRALGTLRTSSLSSAIGTEVTNGTGAIITDLQISYVGEQWRLGALGREDRLDFTFSLDATSLATGTWVDVNELDFVAPVSTGTTGALDGNDGANQALFSFTLTGLSLAPGSTLWLRWSDYSATSSNDGLAIDDVSITALQDTGPTAPPVASVPETMPLSAAAVVLLGLLRAGASSRRSRTAA